MNETSSEIVSDEERCIRKLEAEVDILYRAGIVEIAVRNPSVAEYMRHWEDRAIKAERERDGWQPIETAPRDRAPVIIAVPTKDRDDYIVGEAYFDPDHYDGGDWWWAGTSYGDYAGGPISDINHHGPEFWQPLPKAPTGVEQPCGRSRCERMRYLP